MRLLPKWVMVESFPSIYDFESVTATQQTARVYGAMQEMIREYNKFADQINKEIVAFVGSSEKEIYNFKESVEKRIRCKFEAMDAAFSKMKVDISKYADDAILEVYDQYLSDQLNQIVNEKIASGDIEITLVYDPETETLNVAAGGA